MDDLESGESDWEEVDVPQVSKDIEITLEPEVLVKKKKHGISHAERMVRIDCHKVHTMCLLMSGRVRNKWLNDPLLHARLMSLTPMDLQNAFTKIRKSTTPDQGMRGHLFENAVKSLAEWWSQTYFDIDFEGHLRNQTFDEIQAQIAGLSEDEVLAYTERAESCEIIKSAKSLMKHALNRTGTRDVSAQLFTALCRALGIPARLVFSLQSVPWQASVGKPSKPAGPRKLKPNETSEVIPANGKGKGKVDLKGKGKMVEFKDEGVRLDGMAGLSMEETAKPKAPPVINLRKSKNKGQKLGSSATVKPRPLAPPDPLRVPPVFWTEVFSRADGKWLPVDPIRGFVNKRKVFDPVAAPAAGQITPLRKTRIENRMLYVVAYEEDGYGRDVTPRYARDYAAKVAKVQGAGARATGTSRREWWESVVSTIKRPYQLQRDDLEDEELRKVQNSEGMPTTISGFKDHPVYALARHLKRDEVIHPLTELGKFRGEPVYARSCVHSLKTADNWMRSGRSIKAGVQPMKWVKQRASTIQKQREIQGALEERERIREKQRRLGIEVIAEERMEDEGIMRGLYAKDQTELYIPPPIVDGKIPKNDFGNIDLYVPTMLPQGAAHVPYKGVAKIARKLGINHAEAVTGFEFRKKAATPILQGVVIAAENEAALLEAYWEHERESEDRARVKREERVMKRWIRLVQGLRIRQRLQAQYADRGEVISTTTEEGILIELPEEVPEPGGFDAAAEHIVQKYSLPKFQHVPLDTDTGHFATQANAVASGSGSGHREENGHPLTYDLELMDDDQDDMEVVVVVNTSIPLRMSDLAETSAAAVVPPTPRLKLLPPKRPTKAKAPAKVKVSPKTRASRKRARRDSDSDGESGTSGTTGSKKIKFTASAPAPAAVTRVLRSRAGKSSAKLQEEEEQERAFLQATEE